MNVLGISAFYHDASAAVIAAGKLAAAAAEERYTRQKHDPNFPKFAIEHCLRQAGLTLPDLDAVVFYEEPHTKFSRVLASVLSAYPRTRSTFVRSMKEWIGSKLWLKDEFCRRLGVAPDRIVFCPHHESHACQAFAASPFDEAAVLTVDAVGEWPSTGLFRATKGAALVVKPLDTVPYPHSLGLLYSTFTAFLGFRPNDGESNVMALASFGKPRYEDEVRKVLRLQSDGTYEIDQSFLDHFGTEPFTRKFTDLFGRPRSHGGPLPFSTLGDAAPSGDAHDQRFADVASSLQCVMEDALVALARRLKRVTGSANLCFAGGVALNCVANTALLRDAGFANVFIPPDPGDGGAAIGAAAHVAFASRSTAEFEMSPYLGSSHCERADIDMLERIDPAQWRPYRRPDAPSLNGIRIDATRDMDFEKLVERVVDDLRAGRIVGWFQGRFENGPRALGNRSLLADPARIDVARRLSTGVKTRASFRPYAFSVTAEHARRCMDLPAQVPLPAKWMQMVATVPDAARSAVRAAVHVDGTNRAQVCAPEDNQRFHRLLSAFGEVSGLGALLNTSFNDSGFPIVATPAEALLLFARSDLDTLVLNDALVRKVTS